MRVAWVLLASMGLAASIPLDMLLLFGADTSFFIGYFLVIYGWPVLMLLLAIMAWRWLSPLFLFVGSLPLLCAPIVVTGLDPIPWLAGLAFFAAIVVAITEVPASTADGWHERRSH